MNFWAVRKVQRAEYSKEQLWQEQACHLLAVVLCAKMIFSFVKIAKEANTWIWFDSENDLFNLAFVYNILVMGDLLQYRIAKWYFLAYPFIPLDLE